MWPGPTPGEALGPEVPGTEGSEARLSPHPTAPGRTKETRSVWDKWGPEGPQSMRAHGRARALPHSIQRRLQGACSPKHMHLKHYTWRTCERHPPWVGIPALARTPIQPALRKIQSPWVDDRKGRVHAQTKRIKQQPANHQDNRNAQAGSGKPSDHTPAPPERTREGQATTHPPVRLAVPDCDPKAKCGRPRPATPQQPSNLPSALAHEHLRSDANMQLHTTKREPRECELHPRVVQRASRPRRTFAVAPSAAGDDSDQKTNFLN